MNLFGGSKPRESTERPATPPAIDAARERVEGLQKAAGMRGRAAALLASGSGGPMAVAKREVTGN